MARKRKHTKEVLEPIVKSSVSYAGVIKALGLRQTGGTQGLIKSRIAEYEIDVSHFLGQGSNHGKNHKGGPRKKHWSEILIVSNSERREDAWKLRRALIESGREYKCEGIDCPTEEPTWRGKELRLQVDHKSGDFKDNQKENLRFLCPNCHSQTENFSGSKGFTGVVKRQPYKRNG